MRALLALCVFCACAVWLPRAAAEQRLRVCGRELTETLTQLCKDRGGFNEPRLPHTGAEPGRRASDKGRSTVSGVAAPASRGGVASDCCQLGCSLSTMLSYCKFDDVVVERPPPPPPPADGGACKGDERDDDDELFSLQLLHRPGSWCGAWQPAAVAPPGGEVECTCSRGGDQELATVVRKRPRQPRPTPAPATRRPVVRGTVKPYFAGRPVLLYPANTQRLPATA